MENRTPVNSLLDYRNSATVNLRTIAPGATVGDLRPGANTTIL